MADLDAFLWAVAARPFAWGESDCCIGFVGAWVRACRGGDPEAAWRGRYRTELGCARLLQREGGVPGVITQAAGVAGLIPTQNPSRGCIGVVVVPTRRGVAPAAAICTGGEWAVRTAGVSISARSVLAAWEV